MHWAVFTTILFALSAVSGQRTAIRLGGLQGNFLRLVVSTAVLWAIVLLWMRPSLAWPTFGWFFLSGLIGFGVGDVGLYLAYERIGSRLAILLNLCLAPLFAVAAEWIWLGNLLPPPQFTAAGVILFGVALALWPTGRTRSEELKGRFSVGVIAAIVAGFGQGTGAVISRKANEIEQQLGIEINGLSEAAQRVIAGLLVGWLAVRIWGRVRPPRPAGPGPGPNHRNATFGWVAVAALAGPVLGVSCFQQSLEAVGSSGLVLAVVATTPIVLMPMALLVEKDRPTRMSILGAVIAVGGVVALNLLSVTGGK
jgi:drug/metabolite transporter (DMT)-like permease